MNSYDAHEQTSKIGPGDHLVILYENENEIFEYMLAYIQESLNRNERCIYIKGNEDNPLLIERIKELENSKRKNGELVVLDDSEAYSKDGVFSSEKMIGLIKDLTNKATSDGYSALSITGEISSVLDFENGRELIIEYEWKLNEKIFRDYPISALCRYNIKKFPYDLLINVIQVHPYLIWKEKTHQNPFYIPPEGYRDNQVSKYQVETWLKNISKFTDQKNKFQDEIIRKEKELKSLHKKMTKGVIEAMSELLSVHDTYTKNHSQNVARYSEKFSKYLNYPKEKSIRIYYAGIIHDIGKTFTSREILNKARRLTKIEYEEVMRHTVNGYKILEHIEDFNDVSKAVRHHHERWDGRGYPDGLKGDEIPEMARIINLADSYDAMVNSRPYRDAFSHEYAIKEIKNCAGAQFDPMLASEFIRMLSKEQIS